MDKNVLAAATDARKIALEEAAAVADSMAGDDERTIAEIVLAQLIARMIRDL